MITFDDGSARELNPAQENRHANEIPTPERQTGNAPQMPTEPSGSTTSGQQGGRDTEEDGKWQAETR